MRDRGWGAGLSAESPHGGGGPLRDFDFMFLMRDGKGITGGFMARCFCRRVVAYGFARGGDGGG